MRCLPNTQKVLLIVQRTGNTSTVLTQQAVDLYTYLRTIDVSKQSLIAHSVARRRLQHTCQRNPPSRGCHGLKIDRARKHLHAEDLIEADAQYAVKRLLDQGYLYTVDDELFLTESNQES